MISEDLSTQILKCFQQQVEATNILIQALNDERQALADRNFGEIEKINQQKTDQTLLIESLTRKQTELLRSIGLSLSASDLDELISRLSSPQANKLKKLRNELRETLTTCQEINLINGNIIANNKQSAETALAILRGQVVSDSLTYGPGGQSIKDKSTIPLSKA